jgi:hypothetical protein
VASSEVGAIEAVDRAIAAEVRPGDVEGYADAIAEMLARTRAAHAQARALARAEARRLFAPEVVCGQISLALEALVKRERDGALSPQASRRAAGRRWGSESGAR